MNSLSVTMQAFGSILSHAPVHGAMLMSLPVLWTCMWKHRQYTCSAVHTVSTKCVCMLVIKKTAWNHATQHNVHHIQSTCFNKSAVSVWVLRFSHSLPSCQPLLRWAKAYTGTTERNDSPLEGWQQPTGCNPDKPQQLLSYCLQSLSSSLYFFVLEEKIWQIFPSQGCYIFLQIHM